MIRVLVWAKSGIMRSGLEALVRADARFEVADSRRRTANLQMMVRELAPDVVLFDGSEEPSPSLLFRDNPNGPSVVVLVDKPRRVELLRALRSGVRGLLEKDAHPDSIVEALAAVHSGLVVTSPEILDVLTPTIGELAADEQLPAGEPLTSREIEVLVLLAGGAGNKEIASRMQISEHTVKFHVSSILSKLGAATRTEAVTRGYKEGLILI